MAGIRANSITKAMSTGDTATDKTVTGYLAGETITLTNSDADASDTWALSMPSGAAEREALDRTAGTFVKFTPRAPGVYVVSSKAYVLRIAVVQQGVYTSRDVLRLLPLSDAQVSAPSTGLALYTDEAGQLKVKDSSNTVFTVSMS